MGKKIRVLLTDTRSEGDVKAIVSVALVPSPILATRSSYILFLHAYTDDDHEHNAVIVLEEAFTDSSAIRAGIKFIDELHVADLPVA